VHFHLMVNGFGSELVMFILDCHLIVMHTKCGSVESSILVFYKLKEKNLF
jgi:hypothetical protein